MTQVVVTQSDAGSCVRGDASPAKSKRSALSYLRDLLFALKQSVLPVRKYLANNANNSS